MHTADRSKPNPNHRSAKRTWFTIVFLFAAAPAISSGPQGHQRTEGTEGTKGTEGKPCIEDREALLQLDQHSFDQDLEGGWRPIASRAECRLAAADLIAEYRQRRIESATEELDLYVLYWHEGQLRAMSDDSEAAVTLFESAYSPTEDEPSWVFYAEATIAFLRRDRAAAERARAQLLEIERPSNFEEQAAELLEKFDYVMTWPPNLDVVDGLLHCWEEPYRVAYGQECRQAPREE